MVTSNVDKVSPTRVKLTVNVTPDELKPSLDHAYKHIAEQINIPGFRKGKVPPAIVDQRVGRPEVLNHAVGDAIDTFYRQAVEENELRVLGRAEADVAELPNIKDFTGDLVLTFEVDVRPEFDLPEYDGLEITVDAVEVSDEEIEEELQNLRTRFGTLVTVDRPATTGDFVQIDLTAKIGDEEVDNASGVSYELGSGDLIDGIDEALESLTADESTTFESKLLGGDHEGETAQIAVTVTAVKERELPDADDEFAQIASQFDTLDELKVDLKDQIVKSKSFGQGTAARDQLVEKLLDSVEIPISDQLIEDEVHRHLENENRLEDDEHRAEVAESSQKAFKSQLLLDAIAEAEKVQVSQEELTQYLIQAAAQYGMEPGEFIKVIDQNGQIPGMVGEVARSKAVATVLAKAKVVDTDGKPVDLSAFTAGVAQEDDTTDAESTDAETADAK
ncbi:trigger factor [Curtobacterium sp. RRHDQ10]|uniref:trigger factor n=1 Tax=Curtobacterium phyllosphaerae TaxID=3413379 RepID=UPI003BF3D97E